MRSMTLVFLISLFLIPCSISSSYTNNTIHLLSSIRCHPDESSALLGFLNTMTTNYSDPKFNHFTRSWKKGTDCCGWDGITCHPTSHHVVELNLMDNGLVGTLDSNNTLFHLRHLRLLDLSENDFCHSPISPVFGSSFPHLEWIYIVSSNFSSEVPPEISQLSKLQCLCFSTGSDGLVKMNMSTFHDMISNMTHLTELYLNGVNIDSTIPSSLTNLSSLTTISLENCNLRGELPSNIFTMPHIQYIRLEGNHDLHANFQVSNWSTSLLGIDLSNINFSSKLPPSFCFQSQYNNLEFLVLRGCSFYGQIPEWMWSIAMSNNTRLSHLDLSDNKFNGSINLNDIHSWKYSNYFNISHNYFTGRLTSLPWIYMNVLDLSYNMFSGPLLIPPIGLFWFSASNNNFTGPLPSSFCNLTSLAMLDLSNNILNDEIPHCLSNLLNNLLVLNLGSNNISGPFPDVHFSNCSSLQQLDLSNNWFEGLVPLSLSRCNRLKVLNLRSNKFLDEFPHWFDTFSHIRVLDLSNNGFFGPLPPSYASNSFPELQVLDLSNNNLSGKIPVGFVERFKAMMNMKRSVGGPEYMKTSSFSNLEYYYSITLTFNGIEFVYKKIITTLATFDLSNNKFKGEIPNNIGKLVSLHGLNLSHNQLIGCIPPSLGNLKLLNYLDLSSNKLTGKIPQELTSLSSLGVFNVSENQLEGPIPNDNHFQTFPVDSFKGNPALCGLPLPECGEKPSKYENRDEDEGMMSEWKVVMMGFGFGTFVSFAWGCFMLSIGRPLWLLKLVLILVDLLERRLLGRRGRRPTRGRN